MYVSPPHTHTPTEGQTIQAFICPKQIFGVKTPMGGERFEGPFGASRARIKNYLLLY